MNRVSLHSDLEIKPKFNDPVIPAWKPGSSAMDGTLNTKEVFVTSGLFQLIFNVRPFEGGPDFI